MPQELVDFGKASYGLVTAPWFPYVMAGLAVLLGLWHRRDALKAKAVDAYTFVLGKATGATVPKLSATHILLLFAVLSWAAQRDWNITLPTFPTTPSTPVAPATPTIPDGVSVSFDGFRVLVVEESGTRPPWLYELTASPEVQAYLASHCEGGVKGWKVWDQHTEILNAPVEFKELMGVPRESVPCVVVGVKKQAKALPIPHEPAAFIELLKKYGGA
jgi:hypothetical protein